VYPYLLEVLSLSFSFLRKSPENAPLLKEERGDERDLIFFLSNFKLLLSPIGDLPLDWGEVTPVEWVLSHDEAGSPAFKCGEEVTASIKLFNVLLLIIFSTLYNNVFILIYVCLCKWWDYYC